MFLYGFLLALAFVALAVLALGAWALMKAVLTVSRECTALGVKVKTLEARPALSLDDVHRLILDMPARPGPAAVPLDQLPREQMPDEVAAATFTHAATKPFTTPRGRIVAYEAQQRAKAEKARTKPQGGPEASE